MQRQGERVAAPPSVRRLARELGVDLAWCEKSGVVGLHREDVLAASENTGTTTVKETGNETRIPMRGVRRSIAQNMVRSKFTAPHFTYVEELDLTMLVALRQSTKGEGSQARS